MNVVLSAQNHTALMAFYQDIGLEHVSTTIIWQLPGKPPFYSYGYGAGHGMVRIVDYPQSFEKGGLGTVGGGWFQVYVRSLQRVMATCRQHPMCKPYLGPTRVPEGTYGPSTVFVMHDPEGNLVEFIEVDQDPCSS
jgi:hypothetical protein